MSADEPQRNPRDNPHAFRQLVIIGVVASAIGIAVALWINWFPTQASTQGKKIDTLWDVLLIFSVPIFVLVETIVLYSAIRFRMRPGEELLDGPPIHGNTRLEIIWTAIPAILLVGLCSYAYATLINIEKAPAAEAMKIRVVGEQFTWTFHYQGEGGKDVSSPRLYVPENQAIDFTVQSKDVIHDFWVPAFRMKIDAVPGIDTHLRVTTNDKRGEYPVVCAELCGLGHSTMRQTAYVMSRDAFDAQMKKLASGGAGGGGGGGGGSEETDGKTLFTTAAKPSACSSCHTLADAGATATIGPNLDQVVPKLSLAEVKQSIQDPNAKITEGYQPDIMPNFGETLSAAQVNALAKYLKEVAGK